MRVSFYTFFKGGGIGRYAHEQLQALCADAALEVELMCTPEYEWSATQAYPVWPGLRAFSHRLPAVRRYRFLQQQFVNPVLAIRHARSSGADILHFTLPNHLSYRAWEGFLRRTGLKVVTTVHDVRRARAIVSRSWEDEQLRAFYRSNDALFVHSPHQAEDLVSFAKVDPGRVHVVPHGPYRFPESKVGRPEARQRLGIPEEAQVALLFGSLRDDKNLASLIAALARSPPKVHLLVAGPVASGHRGIADYSRLAEAVGVRDRITFVSRYVPDGEVALVFAAADYTVLPYVESFSSQSGVLNVAVCQRKPVLVSSAPVLREMVESFGIGIACDGDTPESLAHGMKQMSLRAHGDYSRAFDAYCQRNSWAENARRTSEVYRCVLDSQQ